MVLAAQHFRTEYTPCRSNGAAAANFTSDELARTQGAMDASNLLKPMLGRGELRCIGATTLVRPCGTVLILSFLP